MGTAQAERGRPRALCEGRTRERATGWECARCNESAERARLCEESSRTEKRSGQRVLRSDADARPAYRRAGGICTA